ncbi:MAG TPA: L-histidine N(alpha)-methyltransferase [Gaiellaceae bacterium]|nr:L-histidine N(alpha)-methyltransferase [Gaiellaceae bacterium]
MTDHTALAPRVRVEVLLDEDDRRAALHDATFWGLRATPKQVPSVWLYDERGSRIFDEITRLPEYYPTRREREILERRASEIARTTRAETLVELGSGTSEKTRLLLDALSAEGTLARFVPLDVSEEVLVASAYAVADEYPGIAVHAVVGDFERHLERVPADGRRLVAFLGSTIGNLVPAARARFLTEAAGALREGDRLLLGLDLVKDPARIEAAYDDAAGVSERFQRNALAHLDRELGSSFADAALAYRAAWDPVQEWMDIGFRSLREQAVAVPVLGIEVHFAQDELLRIEVSTKFRRERVERELAAAGLALERWWTDPAGDFAVALARSAEDRAT